MSPVVQTSSGKARGQTTTRVANAVLPLTLFIVGFFIFFRWQIFSNFDLVFGDRGDARFVTFIHEHVYRWLQGDAALLSPPFFFNQTKTLGYSDGFLLDQLIYAPLHFLGAEPLLAVSLIAMVLSPIAFLFLYLFLRRLDISVPLASLGALLFTFANNLYLKSNHLQHFAVYYIPVIVCCGLLAVTDVHRRPLRAYPLAALAAGVYGLLFSTGYYMAWFFGLALLIFTPVIVTIAWPQVRSWWSAGPTRVLGLGVVAGFCFLAVLTIFVAIYAPVLAMGARRNFGEYLYYAPHAIDIVNVGMENLVWSDLIRALGLIGDDRLGFNEASIALTPIVQILLVASAVFAFRPRLWPAGDAGRISRALVIAGASVCVLFFLLPIQVHHHSLFQLLYAAVPGAKAIRDGYRGMIVANLFAVTAIGLAFTQVIRFSLAQAHASVRLGRLGALTALLALAAIEQVNLAQPAILSRSFERQHFAVVGQAPRACRTFYVATQPDRAPDVQVDALMLALAQHLPTINGYSGLNPPGWYFYDPHAPDYEQRAEAWAVRRHITEGLCRVDIHSGAWTVVDLSPDWMCGPGGCVRRISFSQSHEFEIDPVVTGNGVLFEDDHWSGPEPSGQWTDATEAALAFALGTPRDLGIVVSIRPLLSSAAPTQSVWLEANRCRIGGIEFDLAHGTGPQTISGTIPTACIDADGTVVLRIKTDRARSPKDIGINHDARRLGVGVERVVIRE